MKRGVQSIAHSGLKGQRQGAVAVHIGDDHRPQPIEHRAAQRRIDGHVQAARVRFGNRSLVRHQHHLIADHRQDRRAGIVDHRAQLVQDQAQQRLHLQRARHAVRKFQQHAQLVRAFLHPLLQPHVGLDLHAHIRTTFSRCSRP